MTLQREVLRPRLQMTREDVEAHRRRMRERRSLAVLIFWMTIIAVVWMTIIAGVTEFWRFVWDAL